MVILNFHGIGTITRKIDAGEESCWIETDFLCSILDFISGKKDIMLTVDDGNKSDLVHLLPELQKRNLICTFFICSDRIGKPTFLNSDDINKIKSAGMPIGTHGAMHKSWRSMKVHELHQEIVESSKMLEEITGQKIDTAACPFGEYDRRSLHFLRKAGFKKVYTSCTGHCSGSDWLSPRNTINRSMKLSDVKKILSVPSLVEKTKYSIKTTIKKLR